MSDFDKVRAIKWSLYAILSVVLFEFAAGFLANSLVVITDAAHAALDAVTTAWLLYATKISLQPPDIDHTYGHEKIETLGGQFGGIALFGIASLLFYESIIRFSQSVHLSKEFAAFAFVAVFYTLCTDVFRIMILRNIKGSISARANFFNALSDFSSTIVALLGLTLSFFGFVFTDTLGSLFISCMLGFLSLKLIYNASLELSDIAPAREYKAVESLLENIDGLKGFRSLRMRKVGTKYFIDVTILLSSTINIESAHNISSTVEERIKSLIKNATIMVHYEPAEEELPFSDQVEKVVMKNKNVKDVHQIISTKTEEGTFLTLHIEVNPNLPLSEAHQISEKIEKDIKLFFPNVQKTTVHIEASSDTSRGEIIYEEEDISGITKILASDQKIKKVSSIKIYKSKGNKYVDITCSFNGIDSIEEVHKEINVIENMIKKYTGECVVTIHPEPF
ncbi:MAG: cation diffusion facilitator family transporter [Nitrososphaeria archaeon]|jgi:cation diffusion facilitator family transporter